MSGSGDSFSELGEPFGLRFKSSQDFAAEYRKRSCDKGEAEELYIHVLRELKKSLKEGNVDSFKKFGDFIDCISNIEDVATLTKYYSNSSNPIKYTNFVILSCKYNSLKILEYLFGSVSKVLQNLTVGVGNKPILPDDEDEMRHNAFYYAIRSGNVELLGILINKWPCNYFSTRKDELNEIVSNAYEELLIKNVLLSEDMTIYVEKELVNTRFYSVLPEEQYVENTLDCIRERVGMVRDCVNKLKLEYLGNEKGDAKFFFIAKFVTQNIHILKHQLKSTYDRLPWEEMEFCLIRYISYQIKPEQTGLFFNVMLTKTRILNFLLTFADRLTDEVNVLDRVETFTNLPNVKHEQIVAEIIAKYPEFGELYGVFIKIRNVHSLLKISENLDMALSADPKQRQGQLIITRVLHNVSELLKNTLESPNLSTSFGEFLLLSIPAKTRSILIDFRNSNSYSYSFSKRIELARKADVNFFVSVQNDFKRLNFIIRNAIYCLGKCKAVKMLLQSIIDTNNMADIAKTIDIMKKLTEIFESDEGELLELLIKDFSDYDRGVVLIERIQREEFDPEQVLINQIQRQSPYTKLSVGVIETDEFKRLMSIGTALIHNNGETSLTELKNLATKLLTKISFRERRYKSYDLKELIDLCLKLHLISTGYVPNDDRNGKISEIIFYASFGMGDWEWADELKKRLFKIRPLLAQKLRRPFCRHIDLKDKYEKLLTEKVSELKTILSENSYTDNYIDNIKILIKEKKVLMVIEILLLDILSILNDSKKGIENDYLFLDDGIPLLIGKDLLHHLSHENSMLDIFPHDPSIALILNAKKIVMKLGVKTKDGQHISTSADFPSLKIKYTKNLIHLTHQEEMFTALEQGNLQELKTSMNEGADINARNEKLWSALHFAAKGPSLDVVKFVLEQNMDVNAEGLGGKKPIHIAAANGRKNIVEFLVKTKGVYVDWIDKINKTPLHFAAGNGHLGTINVLLDSGADPKYKSVIGFSSLHYAISNDCLGVAKALLQKEANVDINQTLSGQTCLHLAASRGYLQIVQFLLTNNADVDARDLDGSTPLHKASENGHLDVVKVLVLNNANVNYKNVFGCSPLHLAVEKNHTKIVVILLEKKANVNVVQANGLTPLHVAAYHGHEKIVEVLLQNKANGYATNDEGVTPLLSGVMNGHLQAVDHLKGYCVNTVANCGREGFEPLHMAAVDGNKKLVELLIKNGADVNVRSVCNATPLHLAARKGSRDLVSVLIENKAQINATNVVGETPLTEAANYGNESAAELLLKCKADVNSKNIFGRTPLHHAVQGGCTEIVKLFLQNGAKANRKEACNATPLHLAVLKDKEDIINVLLANSNVQVNITKNLSFLLKLAVLLNHKEMIKTLIRIGARVNVDYGEALSLAVLNGLSDIAEILFQNTDRINIKQLKMTPLHMAAKNGHANLVNTFIGKEAWVNMKSFAQLTPLCYAAEGGHDEIAEILISKGANFNPDKGISPLHIAAFHGHCCLVDVLIRHGAKLDLTDRHGSTALEVAITRNNFEVVQILLENAKHCDCPTILHIASGANNLKMVEYLVDEGCDINARNEFNFKPIHTAASKGHIDIVKFFQQKELGTNERGSQNQTLLHVAARNGHDELVKFLIEQGADIDARDDDENTPMHLAAATHETSVTQILLKSGATFNATNKYQITPIDIGESLFVKHLLTQTQNLFDATQHNNWSKVEKLIAEGAVVNAKKVGGGAPLHFAAWKGYDKVASILLKNEGDPNILDNKGLTPLHYAARFSHLKIVKMLLAHGAVYNTVSSRGKTPSELTTDWHVGNLLNLIAKSFQNVAENRVNIVNDLNKITDTSTIRAVMCARNVEQKTLLVVADQCNFSKVEELMAVSQDVLKIRLASLAFEGEDYGLALSLTSAILEERKKLLGPNNPALLIIERHIAESLIKLGNHDEALSILQEIYEKQEKIFGLNHRRTLRFRGDVAETLMVLKKYEAALDIFKDNFHKLREMHGLNHEDTLLAQLSISEALTAIEKLDEALILHRSVYKKLTDRTGKTFLISSIKAQKGIAEILAKQNKFEESQKVLKEVLEKEKMIWGGQNIETLTTLTGIALLDMELNRRQDALDGFQKASAILKQTLGETHELTLNSQLYVAAGFFAVGDLIRGLELAGELELNATKIEDDNDIILKVCEHVALIQLRYKLESSSSPAEMVHQLYYNFKVAARNGDVKTIQRLIEDGIDVNKKDADRRAPLHYAISNGHIDAVDILLRSKADVAVVTAKGNTPLHTAVFKGCKDIVEILLKNVKPDKLSELIDAQTTASRTTALHVAAEKGHFAIAKCLLENGATYNMKNKEGKTPIDLSQNKRISSLLTLIEELFKCAKSGSSEVINKVQEIRPDDLKAVANARSSHGSLLEITKDEPFARQLLEMLQKPT